MERCRGKAWNIWDQQRSDPKHCICDNSYISIARSLLLNRCVKQKGCRRPGMLESGGCQEQLVGRVLVAPSCLQVWQSGLWLGSVRLRATLRVSKWLSGFAANHRTQWPTGIRRGSLHHAWWAEISAEMISKDTGGEEGILSLLLSGLLGKVCRQDGEWQNLPRDPSQFPCSDVPYSSASQFRPRLKATWGRDMPEVCQQNNMFNWHTPR